MKKSISVKWLIVSIFLAAVIGFMSAYSLTSARYKTRLAAAVGADSSGGSVGGIPTEKLAAIAAIVRQYSLYDVTEEDLCQALVSGYSAVERDKYAVYYSADAYSQQKNTQKGDYQGIGISVTEDAMTGCLLVVDTVRGGPAESAGILMGDRITEVCSGGVWYGTADLGYDASVSLMLGATGTYAEFRVQRGTLPEETLTFSVLREAFSSLSVRFRVSEVKKDGESVGVVRIYGFDQTTPAQFREAMDGLLAADCRYFLFDVRGNPGGSLGSVEAVLSTLVEKDKALVIYRDKNGNEKKDYAKAVEYGEDSPYFGCSVTEEQLGMYFDAVNGKCAILTDANSASGAELFTAVLKDYGIGFSAGVTTFGKGVMQTEFSLADYGFEGALKLTTYGYYPPVSEGYDGVGIAPDVPAELGDARKNTDIDAIPENEDNQLLAAIAAIK